MKLLSALLLFGGLAFGSTSGTPYTYRVNFASTNLTATFPAAPQLTGPTTKLTSFDISNTSTFEIEVNCSESSQPTSTSGSINVDSIAVPGNSSYSSPINSMIPYPFGKVCWFRSVTGTANSGIFEVNGWGY